MADLSDPDGVASWFAVLPDCAAANPAAQSFVDRAPQVVAHKSGRPWLLGRWPAAALAIGDAGPVRLAVLGSHAAGTAELAELAGRAAAGLAVGQWCREVGRLPGSFHVLASIDGTALVRGTASGLRRVFHARIAGVPVAADRARVLATAAGAGPDPAVIAAALLAPSVPHPLKGRSPWRLVSAVPPDHCLTLDQDGAVRTPRWWSVPEPERSLPEGAEALRERLRAAVAVRVGSGGRISADLSGGVDSTALCFLAAEQGADLLTLRMASLDPGSDDPLWARRAASRLGAAHLVIDPIEVFDGPVPPRGPDDGEEPVGGLMTRSLMDRIGAVLAAAGSGRHLAGYGGDEIAGVSRAYLRDLLPRRPRLAMTHLRGHRAMRAWRLTTTVRALCDHRSYRRWLTAAAANLHGPVVDGAPQLSWGGAVRMPPWGTPETAELVREALTAAAPDAEPLARDRAQHRAVTAIWSAADSARQVGRATPAVPLAAPFLDDPVVEAALAVDLAERGTPWRFKPLLTEALRPVLPAELGERRTKAVFAAEGMAGLRRHRATLMELWDNPLLARMGLVDAAALRAASVGLDPSGRTLMALENTVAVELWLRAAVETAGAPEGSSR